MLFELDPLTLKKIKRFRSIKRGYCSFIVVLVAIILSLFAECLVNSRALVVKYNGHWYFPTYSSMITGKTLGLDYDYETNYRDLKKVFAQEQNTGNFVILPLVPYNPYENDLDTSPPSAPDVSSGHYLGTETSGRDVLARLVYGFRIGILFSLFLIIIEYSVGITIGCLMGYFGGKFDLIVQRLIEVWTNIPFLYIVMIVASIITPSLLSLIAILVLFQWPSSTWVMRTLTYREKSMDYVMAARSIGMSTRRIIFSQVLPNTIAVIVTKIPFSISGGIVLLSSLDFLGFGLPPPTPSWGELLSQGIPRLESAWIAGSVVASMILLLVLINLVGEAVREAFDPKKHTTYE